MKTRSLLNSLALGAVLFGSYSSFAKEVAGVNLPDSVTVEGKELKLNGAGIRKKFIIKVYVGGLYLTAPAADVKAITASDQPWSVHMHFLRSVDKEKIVGAYREGFEKNSKDKVAILNAGLDKAQSAFVDMKEGSEMVVTYVPGKGTTLGIKGGAQKTVEGKDFADGLLRNWLGSEPADENLKEAMLGKK